MKKRQFGRTDMEVTALGFGAAGIGRETDYGKVEKLLGSALDAGLNMIDTAAIYNESEAYIGKAIGHRRDDYYLFTKAGHAGDPEGEAWDAAKLEESIDRSLKRLKTDYVDVVHLHSCSLEKLKQGEVIEVLKQARKKGKARYIGYSGDNEAARFAVDSGEFDSLELSVNIADQYAIDGLIEDAEKKGMGVIAKRPIANTVWGSDRKKEIDYYKPYWERLQKLDYDFLKEDLPSSVEKALRFTLTVPGVDTAIVGTTKPDRWSENAALVGKGPLAAEEFDAVRRRWAQVATEDWKGQV